jgi:hypothetical protein
MWEFLTRISREFCMFFRILRKISREIVKRKSVTILLRELKSKTTEGNTDTRSGRLRSTFPGTGTGARRREEVTIYLACLACNCCHVLRVCSWPCLLLTVSRSWVIECLNMRCRLQFFLNTT